MIYTGGITPSKYAFHLLNGFKPNAVRSWRPLTSYGAYDQPTYWVDITPFIPILLDEQTTHTVTLRVVGQGLTAPSFNSDWFVSGSIHVRTGTSKTTGKIISYNAPALKISTTGGSTPGNTTVWTKVVAHRELDIKSELLTSEGKRTVSFSQSLDYVNTAQYADAGWIQVSPSKAIVQLHRSAQCNALVGTAEHGRDDSSEASRETGPPGRVQLPTERVFQLFSLRGAVRFVARLIHRQELNSFCIMVL